MTAKHKIFISSVQKELENERAIVQNLLSTDQFLSTHCSPILYECEPASPHRGSEECLASLDACQIYVVIIASEYGTVVGDLSITHLEYRRAKEMGH